MVLYVTTVHKLLVLLLLGSVTVKSQLSAHWGSELPRRHGFVCEVFQTRVSDALPASRLGIKRSTEKAV